MAKSKSKSLSKHLVFSVQYIFGKILSFVQFVGIGLFKLNQHNCGLLQFLMMERWFLFILLKTNRTFEVWSKFLHPVLIWLQENYGLKRIVRPNNGQKWIKVTRILRIFYERFFTLNYYYILNVCLNAPVYAQEYSLYMLRKTILIIIYSFVKHVLMPFHFTVQVSLLLE